VNRQRGRSPARAEDGTTIILTLFYCCLALLLILGVAAATSLYLERKRLFTLADGAALAGAEAFPLDTVRITEAGIRPGLRSADVADAVSGYLASAPHSEFDALRVERAVSVDGQSATVSLSARWRPPVLALLLAPGIPLQVTAVARSVYG